MCVLCLEQAEKQRNWIKQNGRMGKKETETKAGMRDNKYKVYVNGKKVEMKKKERKKKNEGERRGSAGER